MEELQETFMKAKEIRSTKALFSKVTPYPGTKLWETGKELEALTTDDRHSLEDPDGMIDLFLYRSSKLRYWKNLISIDKEDFYTFPNTDTYPNSYVTKKESSGSRVVALYSLVNGGHIYASPNVTYSPFFSGNVQDINTAEEIYSVFKSLN